MKRSLVFALCASFALIADQASACMCIDQTANPIAAPDDKTTPKPPMTYAEIMANRLANAEVVVRGKVTNVQAGSDIYYPKGAGLGENTSSGTFTSYRAVVANFAVSEIVKGKTAKTIQIYTGFGTGDCGIPEGFLISVAWDREISFQLHQIEGAADSYYVNNCDYAKMEPMPAMQPKM